MRLPKRGEKGFTLIELLIVVAILGVLAAVVIPNVGRFLGRGEEEARRVEYNTVRLGVTALMVENGLPDIPNPSHLFADNVATNDMSEFPDSTSAWGSVANPTTGKMIDPTGVDYADGDKPGYLLYSHDLTATDHDQTVLVNTVSTNPMTYYYTCDAAGEIRQFNMADLNHADKVEYTY